MVIIYITIIGDAFVDIIVPARKMNIGNGKVYNSRLFLTPGGTSNVAANIKKLGKNVKFIFTRGKDCFGDFFESELNKIKVECIGIKSDIPTGLCVSLVGKNNDRTMIVNRGANDYMDRDRIYEVLQSIKDSKIIYISGYLLQSKSNKEIIWDISKELKEHSDIWFNPGSPNIITKDFLRYIKQFVDYVLLNFDEAITMSGKKDIPNIFHSLKSIVENIVITDGKNGCYILTSDMSKPIHVPPEKVINAVDTTGAGDAFSAGYLVGFLDRKKPVECGMLGNKNALKIITKYGGWDNL